MGSVGREKVSDTRVFIRLAVVLFLCRTAIGAALIPPWQGPDEPPHYVVAEQVARGAVGDASQRAELEREVLRSMALHDWWRSYRLATPDPLPTNFAQEPNHLGTGGMVQPVYYLLAGSVLRITGVTGLDSRYFVLRLVSVLLGVATIVMAFAGTRLLFDESTACVVALAAALHPQFLLTALSVTPDALANAFGALLWWQGARFIVSGRAAATVIAAGAAVAAALTKRNAVPLLGAVVVLVSTGLWRNVRWSGRSAAAAIIAGCGLIAAAGFVFWTSSSEPVVQLRAQWYSTLFQVNATSDFTLRRAVNFTLGLIDSSWLVAGWLRFPAPDWWLRAVRALTIITVAGAGAAFIRRSSLRCPLGVSSALAASLVVAAIANGLMTGSAPQGRYLFVVAAPLAVLLWVGFAEWWPERWRWLAAPALIALLLFLDVSGWITTMLPAYV